MDGRHVDQFAAYLDKLSQVRVRRAKNGAPLNCGECLLAAGGEYVTVEKRNGLPILRVEPAPFATQRGAINMLMFSAVEVFRHRTIGVVLSGMGRDGQEGIREINRNNGLACIQDPRTCLYKEMASSIIAQPHDCTVATDSQLATFINTRTDTAPADVGRAEYAVTAH
jgi:two-component system chemotaxis response regulator CheB